MKLSMLRAEDRREGENRVLALMRKLFAEGKIEEAQQVVNDEELREELFKQYGID